MYFRITKLLRMLTPRLTWKVAWSKKIYLTFDDGPTPEITDYILSMLDKYDAKATFFCLGKNAARHPELVRRITDAGHALGNHTYCHTKGWKVSTAEYVAGVERAAEVLPSRLFRPPYGRITRCEAKALVEKGYRIIMWNNISQDYNHNVSPEECVRKVTRHLHGGDIIVFHDSVKASRNMMYALPRVLEEIRSRGIETDILRANYTFLCRNDYFCTLNGITNK